MHGSWYDLRDGYVHTNPSEVGTQIAKAITAHNAENRGFSVLKTGPALPDCANANDGLFDCGQGVSSCRSVVFGNFGLFNRIVGAARRLKAARGLEFD
jgi:hypothetical protein